jgi:hypothetical protein
MDHFIGKYKLSKLTEEESLIDPLPRKTLKVLRELSAHKVFTGEFYQAFKEQIVPLSIKRRKHFLLNY